MAPVFHSSNAYLVSATCDDYQKKLLRQVFDLKSSDIFEMKSIQEVSSGQRKEPFISDSVIKETPNDLYAALLIQIED